MARASAKIGVEEVLKPENIKLLSQVVLPGFVIAYVRAQLVPNRPLELKDAIVGYIALSALYQALLAPLSVGLAWPKLSAVQSSFASIGISMVLPALLGLWLGLDGRHGWTRWAFKRVGVQLNHPVNVAWDWKFSSTEECWVMAVLRDGTKWVGYLSPGSFTSTDPAERDLFIEKVYNLEDDNTWTPKGSSVWISHGEIQSLEFWACDFGEANDAGGQKGEQGSGGAPAIEGETVNPPNGRIVQTAKPRRGRKEVEIVIYGP